MSKIYSVSMKGGVGKKSVITNLSSAIGSNFPDRKILIVDTDGQGNSSIAFVRKLNDFKDTNDGCFFRRKNY